MEFLAKALHNMPEIAMFLAVGIGYWAGNIKFGKFSVGTITAALIAGLVIGQQTGVEVSRELRWGLFLLFLFANGYAAGPQFFHALKRDGLRPMLLSIVIAVTGLATTYAMVRLLNLDPGIAAGLFGGALTQSAAIGTATDAIMSLPLPEVERKLLASHAAIADALTYVFGAIGMIGFVSILGPKLLRIDLRKEAVALEAQLGIKAETPGVFSAYQKFAIRAYRLTDSTFVGKRIEEVERNDEKLRYFVERILRGELVLDAQPHTVLERGDVVVVYGRSDAMVVVGPRFGPEVHDPELMDFPVKVLSVVLTNEKLCGPTLEEMVASQAFDSRSVGLRTLTRGVQEIPIGPMTVLNRGDVLELIGPQHAVERVASEIGYALRPSQATSLSTLGLGILLGTLIGLPFVMVGDFKLTLSVSVGTLLAGLFFGWLRSVRPMLGSIPTPALQLMIDFGLAAFIACAGLQAGPEFVKAVKELGVVILLAGVVVTLVPQLAALLIGRFVLRMNPLLLLGGLAGAQTYTPALAALQEKAGSRIPVLGYTVPYATSNVLLTTCGALMVALAV